MNRKPTLDDYIEWAHAVSARWEETMGLIRRDANDEMKRYTASIGPIIEEYENADYIKELGEPEWEVFE